ncbi:3-hydroxyacyl-[acyl-carrier-protein] dehydratase FabZ [Candidatus Pantoea edessiphila]|uniref:3-hydroxyacyl-[acyl-carrier-protein] dehydratase FabZ n=1 Tax=Candidatus Pantoea edessiphila TaxID=2044610 RepID=A0A2P5T0B7_9GAMM|nr:3-hydroxyacyl-ACP dehydratase FabZ [Candidatus Pantoea edessiphila]PPI88006.1 3-hydroxyacyl-[acyl-carrier-protein] dehydratase FabZ [Candidatus Pantoea edessiphila]
MTVEIHNLKVEDILKLLPHRYPFLLIDRVLDFKKHNYLCALKNISINEPFFQGHFPKRSIFPGVLMLEAMAQAAAVLAFKSTVKIKNNEFYYLAGIENARFKRLVIPGDQMITKIIFEKTRCGITRFKGISTVDRHIVCEATIICARN